MREKRRGGSSRSSLAPSGDLNSPGGFFKYLNPPPSPLLDSLSPSTLSPFPFPPPPRGLYQFTSRVPSVSPLLCPRRTAEKPPPPCPPPPPTHLPHFMAKKIPKAPARQLCCATLKIANYKQQGRRRLCKIQSRTHLPKNKNPSRKLLDSQSS